MRIAGRPKPPIRFVLAVAAVGLAMAALSGCAWVNTKPAANNPRQVTVVGSGQVQGVPDTLTADVGIEFTAADITTAMNQTNDRQQAVITALVGAGVGRNDISTTEVSLQPQYGGSGGPITDYRATNSIRVTIRKLDSASRLLGIIVDTGGDATRIDSVRYSIEDDSPLVKDARARAFQDAENRAEQYAQLSGLKLGKVISISEAPATAPTPAPMPRAPMATNVPLEPGQQTVSFSVTVVWELR
jgi:uncharacterized protein YggE